MLYVGCMLVGLIAGFLSVLLGIGGGVLVVPMLMMLFDVPTKVAIGTSLAFIVPVALTGALQHGMRSQVALNIALIALPFGIIGTFIGIAAHDALGSVALKRIFGVLMLLIALKLLLLPQGWEGLLMKYGTLVREGARPAAAEPALPDAHDSS